MGYKLHADSFRDNCLLGKKVNDYKLFPREFDDFVKQSLGLPIENREYRGEEELEYRYATVSRYIEDFLRRFFRDIPVINKSEETELILR